jgi:hypothetical protein
MAESEGARAGSDTAGGSPPATVAVAGVEHELTVGKSFTFGRARSCDVCLDPNDVGISRRAGSIDCVERVWFVTNLSSSRPVSAIDPVGFRTVLAPGRRMAVDGKLSVVVEGQIRRHELVVSAPGAGEPPVVAGDTGEDEGVPTEMGGNVTYSNEDRRALVALFAGYLQPFPRYDPTPRTYAEAAKVLGVPRTTLVKRVEYLRSRLVKDGVPNLFGERAMEVLAEHVIATGVVSRDDLDLLP